MKYIEIASEDYTYRYDFPQVPSTTERWDREVVYIEDRSSADFSLNIALDLLRCAFGAKQVREALLDLDEVDY